LQQCRSLSRLGRTLTGATIVSLSGAIRWPAWWRKGFCNPSSDAARSAYGRGRRTGPGLTRHRFHCFIARSGACVCISGYCTFYSDGDRADGEKVGTHRRVPLRLDPVRSGGSGVKAPHLLVQDVPTSHRRHYCCLGGICQGRGVMDRARWLASDLSVVGFFEPRLLPGVRQHAGCN
jgi:hypothetical protein